MSLACGVDGASVSVSNCDSNACHCNAGCSLSPTRCLQLDIAPECHVYLSSVEQYRQCHQRRQCQHMKSQLMQSHQHLNQCVEGRAVMLVCGPITLYAAVQHAAAVCKVCSSVPCRPPPSLHASITRSALLSPRIAFVFFSNLAIFCSLLTRSLTESSAATACGAPQ